MKPEFEVTVITANDVITDSTYDNDVQDVEWMKFDDIFNQ